MQIIYIDESGDPGSDIYSSPHYILSGIIVSQDNWNYCLQRLKTFRKDLKNEFGLNQRTEIHASELIRINKIDEYRKISKKDRIHIFRKFCEEIPSIFKGSKIINISLRKSDFENYTEFHLVAWKRMIQRFDNYLKYTVNDKGIIIADDTNSKMIFHLLRKMRVHNPVKSHYSGSSRNLPANSILEDLFERASDESYFIQTADVIAQALYRKEYPKGSLKNRRVNDFFEYLKPILLYEASSSDTYGIVRK